MRPAIQRLILLVVAAFVITTAALADDHSALLGTWNMTSETEGDSVQWTLVLKDTEGKLTGTLKTDGGETPAPEFSYTDGVIRFKAPYQGESYDIELKLVNSKLDGTWSGNGASGRTSGTKAQAGQS